ncbi:PQQ-binding-like beta-propeller repeat protein [Nocardiopsis ganjiahuensis]|uniref:PQQ-binding-like beta-propeller repeat protein n=1 Tax=Nocardiopsis ganjiahuensis TaxID=239984 RepID=UPI00036D8CBF|nr:PQQ-binding-like beta-propeller repeat protein [Nocardiopsis ganjiahuensis]
MGRIMHPDTLWRLLSWAGTGSVLGGALVVTAAVVLGPAEWDGTAAVHWALCGAVVLLAVVWALGAEGQRPEGNEYYSLPGEGSGPIRAAAVLVVCLALQVVLRELPEAGEAGVRETGWEGPPPDVLVDFGAVSHLWYLAALALLAGAAVLAVSGRPEPLRPAPGQPRIEALLAGLAPVVALAVFAVPTALERDRFVHTLAEPLSPAESPVPAHADEVAWVWEHPEEGSAGEVSVAATDSGVLVHGARGVWALDSRDGAERWRFQPLGEVLWSQVTPDGGRVAVLYRDDTRPEHEQRSLAVLEADTGRLVGDHRIHRRVDHLLLTGATFVQVAEDDSFTVRSQEPHEEEIRYELRGGCEQVGAPVAAGPRILVPEECPRDEEAPEEWFPQVLVLTEGGARYSSLELPGPVEELTAAPDGWSVVVRYAGDEPGALAFRGRTGEVVAEDLPAGTVPLDGERLLFTETDEATHQAEYRLEKPVVGEPGGEVPDTETLETLAFTTRIPDPDSIASSPELFAALQAGEDDPAVLLVGAWGSDPAAVPLDTAAEGLSPDGSPFGVALAPDVIAVSGLSAGDRAHVIGVGPGPRS